VGLEASTRQGVVNPSSFEEIGRENRRAKSIDPITGPRLQPRKKDVWGKRVCREKGSREVTQGGSGGSMNLCGSIKRKTDENSVGRMHKGSWALVISPG